LLESKTAKLPENYRRNFAFNGTELAQDGDHYLCAVIVPTRQDIPEKSRAGSSQEFIRQNIL
jgi:hypothetical protein